MLKNLSAINVNTIEGRYLLAALSMLTTSNDVRVMGEDINGRQTEPDIMLQHVGKLQNYMFETVPQIIANAEAPATFDKQLAQLLNKFSKENGSNTPDFILAEYITGCLKAYELATIARENWYGKSLTIPAARENGYGKSLITGD